jgi:hypothetical protein
VRDIECALIERWHWNLHDIDETEMESILGFVDHYPRWKERQGSSFTAPMKSAYAEDLDL